MQEEEEEDEEELNAALGVRDVSERDGECDETI